MSHRAPRSALRAFAGAIGLFVLASSAPASAQVAAGSAPSARSAPPAEGGTAGAPTVSAALRAALDDIAAGQPTRAVPVLQRLSAQGDAAASTQLALLHYHGQGVPEDDDQAYRLFLLAAGQGDPLAMFWLGRMNLLGHGPPRHSPDADQDAARWLFESARRGVPDGQYYLGLLFMAGTGVHRDEAEAMKWIRRAAGAGHVAAQAFLGER